MYIVFGVIDFPYTNEAPGPAKVAKPKKGKANKPVKAPAADPGPVMTGQVAEWLEKKYHIMRIFAEMQEPVIEMELYDSVKKQIRMLDMGAPVVDGADLFKQACANIEREFRTFLDENELEDAGVPGVPTMAAQMGINHRFKSGLNNVSVDEKKAGVKGVPRVSFIDTGTYQKAFKCWTE